MSRCYLRNACSVRVSLALLDTDTDTCVATLARLFQELIKLIPACLFHHAPGYDQGTKKAPSVSPELRSNVLACYSLSRWLIVSCHIA